MAILRRRRARRAEQAGRGRGRRRLRRLVIVSAAVGTVRTLRNRKIEENKQRFGLP